MHISNLRNFRVTRALNNSASSLTSCVMGPSVDEKSRLRKAFQRMGAGNITDYGSEDSVCLLKSPEAPVHVKAENHGVERLKESLHLLPSMLISNSLHLELLRYLVVN